MRKIVDWVDLPAVASTVMFSKPDSVHWRVSHVHVWVLHVNFGSQQQGAFCVLTFLHLCEELQVLLHTSVSEWRVNSWQIFLTATSIFLHLFRCLGVNIGFSFLDEIDSEG